MTPVQEPPDLDARQASANRRLGLLLGGAVVVLVAVLVAVFSRTGLPRDPDVWRAAHQTTHEEPQAGTNHD